LFTFHSTPATTTAAANSVTCKSNGTTCDKETCSKKTLDFSLENPALANNGMTSLEIFDLLVRILVNSMYLDVHVVDYDRLALMV
jgi:hypothetical protein